MALTVDQMVAISGASKGLIAACVASGYLQPDIVAVDSASFTAWWNSNPAGAARIQSEQFLIELQQRGVIEPVLALDVTTDESSAEAFGRQFVAVENLGK